MTVQPGLRFSRRCLLILASVGLAACAREDADPERPDSDPPARTATDEESRNVSPEPLDSAFDRAHGTYRQGDYRAAFQQFGAVAAAAEEQGEAAFQARARTWTAYALWHLGDHEGAKRAARDVLDFKIEHGIRDQLFRSYNQLGLFAQREYRYADASRWLERAIQVAAEDGDEVGAASARGNLALVQTELGRFDEARSGFLAQREAMAALDSTLYLANSLNNLGYLEIRVGAPQVAVPLLEEALALYEEVGAPYEVQNALGQLGTAYTALGDPARAFTALDRALTLARSNGLRQDEAINLELIAELYRRSGDFTRALEFYEAAKEINEELGLDFETGIDLRGEAAIHVQLGDMERARTLAIEALEIHRRAGAPLEEILDLLLLAEVQDHLGDARAAEARLRDADRLAGELNARVARVQVALTRARIADRHRRSDEVLRVIRGILPDLARGGYLEEAAARLFESRALERTGAVEQAAAAGRRALETVERVRDSFGSGQLRGSFVASKAEIYAHLVSVLLRLGEVGEAFEIADGARGRAFLERLGTRKEPEAGDDGRTVFEGEGLLSRIDRLVVTIYDLEQVGPDERTASHLETLERLYDELGAARRRYEEALIRRSETDRSGTRTTSATRSNVRSIQAALRPDQLLVEYFVPPEGDLLLFAVARDGVRVLESPIQEANLVSRVRLARDLIAQPVGSQDHTLRVLSRLHDALVQPLMRAGALGGERELIIVPHGVLNYLPFAALRDRTTERYLVEEFTMRVLPSAAALVALNERTSTGRSGALASVFAPFPDRLPGTRQEAFTVSAGTRRTARYVGEAATERALRAALDGSRIVHVATHGILNVRNPMFSRLEMARNGADDSRDDGRLEVHELLDLSVHASMVFLSGCETGVGGANATAFAQGEDFATLAQAFLYAGASNVVATLWPVEDEGAAEFARIFYDHLENEPPALALAAAQRSLLAGERFSSPYYWAAYQVAGDDAPPRPAHTSDAPSVQ